MAKKKIDNSIMARSRLWLLLLFVGLNMIGLTSLQVNAANLIIEDFESPVEADNTTTPGFAGWTWVSNVKSRINGTVPGSPNQALYFEWTNYEAYYDIDHAWAAGNTYVLTLKASPSSWNGSSDRYIAPSLRQQDGTVLWSANEMMPKYDDYNGNPWTAAQTFTWVIQSDDFSTGTAGSNLRLRLDHTGQRGIYIDDVELVEGALPVDNTPPSPDPMGWITAPTVVDFVNVTMTSNLAIDDPYGVQYLFENVTTGANSGWQSNLLSNIWTQANLVAGNTYTYRVKARDLSPNLNETAWSNSGGNVTMDPPDVTAPTPNPMTWSVSPRVVDEINIYMDASTATDPYLGVEYYIENMTTGANSGWQSSSVWYEVGKALDTEHTYRVKSRDLSPNQNTTAWSNSGGNVTITNPPEGRRLLVSGNFEYPVYSNGTADPFFVGWSMTNGSSIKLRTNAATSDVPESPNVVIQLEQLNAEPNYDISHNWASSDVYTLTINASPMSWSGTSTRHIAPSLLQQDNTVLWSSADLLPIYDNQGGNPWAANLIFTYTIPASAFGAGTVGQPLRLKIDQVANRGIYIDNIRLILAPVATGTIFRID